MIEPYNFEQVPLEKSDLKKLKGDVMDLGPEAALPYNLPDAWLIILSRDLQMIQQEENEDYQYLTAPLAIIVHILYCQKGSAFSLSEEELFEYMQDLRFEISIEIARRSTGFAAEPATLDTIFTKARLTK